MISEPLGSAQGAQVEAQAKINLRLRVLAREATGFHQLETLFLRLALADTVRVRRTTGSRSLDVSGAIDAARLGPTEQNLAWRAATAYFDRAGWHGGFAIELVKRIPVGGGLGGGSADAGGVLRVLDAIAPTPLGPSTLMQIAASLGADVPFLAGEHPYVLAWGRGERMLALSPPPVRSVLLAVPAFSVHTGHAFGWLASARESASDPSEGAVPFDAPALSQWDAIASVAVNDFEPVIASRHPEIADCVAALHAIGCAPAMMSGSGSVVFGVLGDGADAAMGVRTAQASAAASSSSSTVVVTATAASVEPVRRLD